MLNPYYVLHLTATSESPSMKQVKLLLMGIEGSLVTWAPSCEL